MTRRETIVHQAAVMILLFVCRDGNAQSQRKTAHALYQQQQPLDMQHRMYLLPGALRAKKIFNNPS